MVMRQTSATGTEPGRQRGFTLVEILIVLGLMALVSAMLVPLLAPSPARTLQTSSSELAQHLRETRRAALSQRRFRSLAIDTEQRRFQVDDGERWRALPDGMTVEVTTARSLLDSASVGRIAFNPDGSSSGGRIVLALDGHARRIDVEWLTGKVRVAGLQP
jgi:general secretion pathway protein H